MMNPTDRETHLSEIPAQLVMKEQTFKAKNDFIFLAVIYFPVVYAMPALDEAEAAPKQNLLEKLGLPFSSEFLTIFVAIFSPALAGPVVELFNFLVGNKT